MLHKLDFRILSVCISMILFAVTLHGIAATESSKTHEYVVIKAVAKQTEKETDNIRTEVIIKEKSKVARIEFEPEEEEILLKLGMAEAEGEGVEGIALVMLVVNNRVSDDSFPDSIREVVFQESSNGSKQFAVMEDGGRYYTAEPNQDCYEALELVKAGWNESENALYFESDEGDSWHSRNLDFLFQEGKHRFYR